MKVQKVGSSRRGVRRAVASASIVALSGAAVIAVGSGVNVGAKDNYTRTCLQDLGQRHIKQLNGPLVDIALTPSGRGCWLVGSDGGVFNFGDAHFYGSAANTHLTSPVVGLTPTPDDHGYWLYASDGGVFAFGDAGYYGSAGGTVRTAPIVDMTVSAGGDSYTLTDSTGHAFTYADAAPSADSLRAATKVGNKIERKAQRKAARKANRKAAHVHIKP